MQAFGEAHPERKLTKKAVVDKARELAEHQGGRWVLRTAPAAGPGSQPEAGAPRHAPAEAAGGAAAAAGPAAVGAAAAASCMQARSPGRPGGAQAGDVLARHAGAAGAGGAAAAPARAGACAPSAPTAAHAGDPGSGAAAAGESGRKALAPHGREISADGGPAAGGGGSRTAGADHEPAGAGCSSGSEGRAELAEAGSDFAVRAAAERRLARRRPFSAQCPASADLPGGARAAAPGTCRRMGGAERAPQAPDFLQSAHELVCRAPAQEPASTADPYWDRLYAAVASPGPPGAPPGAPAAGPRLPGVFFDPGRLGRCAGAVPAAAAAALVKGMGAEAAPAALRGACARAAAHLAMVLAELGAGAGASAPTPSKVRGARLGPWSLAMPKILGGRSCCAARARQTRMHFPLNWLKRRHVSAQAQLLAPGKLRCSIAATHHLVLGAALLAGAPERRSWQKPADCTGSARAQVWRHERAAPVAASLEQLFAEPALMPTLAACLAARAPVEASMLLGARPRAGPAGGHGVVPARPGQALRRAGRPPAVALDHALLPGALP